MGEANLDDIMDGLATASGVSPAYAFPVQSITPPCILVDFPSAIDFDQTFQRGSDRLVVPVWYIVGQPIMGTGIRSALSDALAGAGSVKDALDGVYAFGSVWAQRGAIQRITVSGVEYIGIRFDCEVLT